jgi:UDP-glucuronate decarboxylase
VRDRQKVALVTGGAGFIGSHLCDRLIADGVRVVCLDNLMTGRRDNLSRLAGERAFDFIEHDVIEPLPAWLCRAGITRIYHFACAASPDHYRGDPEHTMLTNVAGTRHVLRLAEQTGARLLLASTSEVYGDPEVHPQTEEYAGLVNCTGPRACYDEGNRAAEALTFDFHRHQRADVRVARIFNTYGPRMRCDDGRVISNLACQALSGGDITIYGDGSQTRSFCFIADMVEGLTRLMECRAAQGLPINLGNPEELSILALAKRIIELTASRSQIIRRPLPTDDPRRRKPDISRALMLLGWRPEVGLEEGLTATIEWFEDERNRIAQPTHVDSSAVATAAE